MSNFSVSSASAVRSRSPSPHGNVASSEYLTSSMEQALPPSRRQASMIEAPSDISCSLSRLGSSGSVHVHKDLRHWQAREDQKIEFTQRVLDFLEEKPDHLDLSHLGIVSLPDRGLNGFMPQLTILSLEGNMFKEVPRPLNHLKGQLKLLNMMDNQLSDIGDAFVGFSKLELLNLSNNQLTHIPEYLGKLERLACLIMRGNYFDTHELPLTLWLIPDVIVDAMRPPNFEELSKKFAKQWQDIQQEEYALSFQTWLFKFSAILIANDETIACHYNDRRNYFFDWLKLLLTKMAESPGMRRRCFEYADQAISHCEDRLLFTIFDMECAHLEEKIAGGNLSPAQVKENIKIMFNFCALKEKSLQYINKHYRETHGVHVSRDAESVETVLGFLLSPQNTLVMPVASEKMRQFYPQLSKATPEAVRQLVSEIRKARRDPVLLIDFLKDKSFWRNFLMALYPKDFSKLRTEFEGLLDKLEQKRFDLSDAEFQRKMGELHRQREKALTEISEELSLKYFSQFNGVF